MVRVMVVVFPRGIDANTSQHDARNVLEEDIARR